MQNFFRPHGFSNPAKGWNLPAILVKPLQPIPQLLHKPFIAQHRLPAHRLKRILHLPHEPFLDKLPVAYPLAFARAAQLTQHHLLLHKWMRSP